MSEGETLWTSKAPGTPAEALTHQPLFTAQLPAACPPPSQQPAVPRPREQPADSPRLSQAEGPAAADPSRAHRTRRRGGAGLPPAGRSPPRPQGGVAGAAGAGPGSAPARAAPPPGRAPLAPPRPPCPTLFSRRFAFSREARDLLSVFPAFRQPRLTGTARCHWLRGLAPPPGGGTPRPLRSPPPAAGPSPAAAGPFRVGGGWRPRA